MIGARLAIAVLSATLISQPVTASRIDCKHASCEFNIPEECQKFTTVYCNLKNRPRGQVNLTATSFPRHVREIDLHNIRELTIETDTIASLASLEILRLHDIDTLTLLPRSLARDNGTGQIAIVIREVITLDVHRDTFSGWENLNSRITIEKLETCRIFDRAIASTHLHSLLMRQVTSLEIGRDAFSANSIIDHVTMTEMKNLSIDTGAFNSSVNISTMTLEDVETLSLNSAAFAPGTSIHKMFIERSTNLHIASGAIKADIDTIALKNVRMATCHEQTFGSTIKSLSLTDSSIDKTQTNCISATQKWMKVLVDSSNISHIDPLAIHGDIEEMEITDSDLGTVAKGGFTVNVANFSVVKSTFGEVSGRALEVHATKQINLKNCSINILKREAFVLLDLDGNAEDRIRVENLVVVKPENGSMQFDHRQNILMLRLEVGIPCTCSSSDMTKALGLTDVENADDARIRRSISPPHVRCENNGTWPNLGEYQLEFCSDPSTTTTLTSTTPDISVTISSTTGTPGEYYAEAGFDQTQVHISSAWVAALLTVTLTLLLLVLVQLVITIPFLRQHGKHWLSAVKRLSSMHSDDSCQLERYIPDDHKGSGAGVMACDMSHQARVQGVRNGAEPAESESPGTKESGVGSQDLLQEMEPLLEAVGCPLAPAQSVRDRHVSAEPSESHGRRKSGTKDSGVGSQDLLQEMESAGCHLAPAQGVRDRHVSAGPSESHISSGTDDSGVGSQGSLQEMEPRSEKESHPTLVQGALDRQTSSEPSSSLAGRGTEDSRVSSQDHLQQEPPSTTRVPASPTQHPGGYIVVQNLSTKRGSLPRTRSRGRTPYRRSQSESEATILPDKRLVLPGQPMDRRDPRNQHSERDLRAMQVAREMRVSHVEVPLGSEV